MAGAFVPINFLSVRFAQRATTHPRVLGQSDALPGPMLFTFLVCLLAMTVLYVTLCKYELTSKHASIRLAQLRRRLAGDDDPVDPPRLQHPGQREPEGARQLHEHPGPVQPGAHRARRDVQQRRQ